MANMFPDGHFDTADATAVWRCNRGATIGGVAWDQAVFRTAPGAARLTKVHTTDTGTLSMWHINPFPTQAGQAWMGRTWVYNASGTARAMRAQLLFRNGSGVDTFVSGPAPAPLLNTWYELIVVGAAPADAVTVRFSVDSRTGWVVNEYWVMDDVSLEGERSLIVSEDGAHAAAVDIQAWPEQDYDRGSAVLPIQGREEPVVLLDTLRLPSSEITFATRTKAEADALLDVFRQRGRLHLYPRCAGIDEMWFALLSTTQTRVSASKASNEVRLWPTRVQRVAAPAVVTPLQSAPEEGV